MVDDHFAVVHEIATAEDEGVDRSRLLPEPLVLEGQRSRDRPVETHRGGPAQRSDQPHIDVAVRGAKVMLQHEREEEVAEVGDLERPPVGDRGHRTA